MSVDRKEQYLLEATKEQGVTVAYRATMEYDPTRNNTSEWGEEFATPLQAVMALTWKVGHLTGDGTIDFSEGIATISRPHGEEDDNSADRWHEFATTALNDGDAEIVLHGKRWLVQRERRECVKRGDQCTGTVRPHESLSGTGAVHAWCETHWGEICDAYEKNRELLSPTPPDWFDPTFAGEAWGENDY